ncbi:hypothetical protein [Micromonospora sp. HUAS LYJ1]|uniref:hypothetical protein n=1 Tax=Micromonospora sp. HUAS LYJ1 TaxID=3061626 RepID=UPI002671B93E|nr:hypothetical protein [Micromonospora sp. HUAS LYJ1]WKU03765.1 hypothetical protein Q2K16_23415 [Micromonospora sp. HUAS LYJ1]
MTPRHLTALTAAVLLLAGCGGDPEPTAAPTPAATSRAPLPLLVRGTFTLELPNFGWSSQTNICAGTGGHDDIAGGTKVVVTDNTGTIVGVGALDQGQPQTDPEDRTRADSCLFQFTVKDVPSGKGFYSIEVSNRGKVQFKETDLAKDFVQLGLT